MLTYPQMISNKELQSNSNLIVLQISFKEIHVVLKGVFTLVPENRMYVQVPQLIYVDAPMYL